MSAEVTVLNNGFRVATDHMPGLRTAAVAVHVNVGARNESARENGIAHFLEHMAFKGTRTRTASQIFEAIEDVGGYLNAYTSRESTVYMTSVLAEDVPLAIELIADILRNSVFSPDEIELERGVILNEIGEYEDSPADMVFDALQQTAYPKQRYGRPIIGTQKTVSSFDRSDLQSFTGRHYGPERMILTASGAVRHDQLAIFAERFFGDAPRRPAVRARPPRFVGGEFRRQREIEQAQFTLAFPGPSLRTDSMAASMVFGALLGGGSSSRLFTEAREKRGLCYSVSAHSSPGRDAGLFVVHASTGGGELRELTNLCADEIRRAADGLTEKEVSRAKTQFRVGILMGHESPGNRIERMGKMLALKGRIESLDETIARYDAVTRDTVLDFAQSLAAGSEAAMALYGPVSQAPPLAELQDRIRP